MVADCLLHGAFEGHIGGADWEQERIGTRITARKQAHLLRLLLPVIISRGGTVKEGDRRTRTDGAEHWELLSSCGEE